MKKILIILSVVLPFLYAEEGLARDTCVPIVQCRPFRPVELRTPECVPASKVKGRSDKNILFAHGMSDTMAAWDTFAAHAKKKGYTVYRVSVAQCDSDVNYTKCGDLINALARELVIYILEQGNSIADGSLVTVGHSMGGIDLRYIVGMANRNPGSDFYNAAKKFKGVFTIASPHGGASLAWLGCSADVGNDCMEEFNKKFTYANFNKPGTSEKLPFLAYHFQCITAFCYGASDGAVGTDAQTWKGAPVAPGPSRSGTHMPYGQCKASFLCPLELSQTGVLDDIIARMER